MDPPSVSSIFPMRKCLVICSSIMITLQEFDSKLLMGLSTDSGSHTHGRTCLTNGVTFTKVLLKINQSLEEFG